MPHNIFSGENSPQLLGTTQFHILWTIMLYKLYKEMGDMTLMGPIGWRLHLPVSNVIRYIGISASHKPRRGYKMGPDQQSPGKKGKICSSSWYPVQSERNSKWAFFTQFPGPAQFSSPSSPPKRNRSIYRGPKQRKSRSHHRPCQQCITH